MNFMAFRIREEIKPYGIIIAMGEYISVRIGDKEIGRSNGGLQFKTENPPGSMSLTKTTAFGEVGFDLTGVIGGEPIVAYIGPGMTKASGVLASGQEIWFVLESTPSPLDRLGIHVRPRVSGKPKDAINPSASDVPLW